jgi:hypothetical protein
MKTNLIRNTPIIHGTVGLNNGAIDRVLKWEKIYLLGIGALFGIDAITQ